MRLWSLHPRYLDAKGLTALWREGLLARKVLSGETLGYRNHPQLERFRAHPSPETAIATYLHTVCDEADHRGYRFNRTKLPPARAGADLIPISDGQLRYELGHLLAKLEIRDPDRCRHIAGLLHHDPHPSFIVVPGPVAGWERPLLP